MTKQRHSAKGQAKPHKKRGPKPLKRGATTKSVTGGLTFRQEQALNFYLLNGGNKLQAMVSAGYSVTTANTNQDTVFAHPEVVRRIGLFHEEKRRKTEVTQDWVLERLKRIGDFNLGNVLLKLQQNNNDLACLTEDERYGLGELVTKNYTIGRGEDKEIVDELKLKGKDTLQSLQLLMRHLGMMNDKVTVSHEITLVDRLQRGRERVKAGSALPVVDVDPKTGEPVK